MTNPETPFAAEACGVTVELLSGHRVAENVTLRVRPGETLGLVGESGSGKTTVALALSGYARKGMRITQGSVVVDGQPIDLRDERSARRARGRAVSHVPQDPATSLNPSLRIGPFLESILTRFPTGGEEHSVEHSLNRVHLPATRDFVRRFPHQLSGGQQQRVLIAAALASEPPLIVLDEPTTGLDVVTQAQVLGEIRRLREEREVAMIYVSHDLSVVSEIADRIAVMYAGRVVEEGPAAVLLSAPRHPYTSGLISSVPDHVEPRILRGIPGVAVGVDDRPQGCAFAPRCSQKVPECEKKMPELADQGNGQGARCFQTSRTPAPRRRKRVVTDSGRDAESPLLRVEALSACHKRHGGAVVVVERVSFTIAHEGCVALVGESGSGKTTIARTIAGLHPPSGGKVILSGEAMAPEAKHRSREQRRRCQIIFQNPYESLNPRQRIGSEISRPARVLRDLSPREADAETARLLELVRLPARLAYRFSSELSGGERQRVAIARALAAQPELMICDEITSALDVSVQAAILELLVELRQDLGLALLFITHNLGVVAAIADRVLILDRGVICEEGRVDQVFAAPKHARTRELIAAAPRLRSS